MAIMRFLLSSLLVTTSSNSGRLLYEHGYHAGNYADVVKHTILIQLLQHMKKKSKPFSYVETHSGAGLYPLQDSLGEYKQGIHPLLHSKEEEGESDYPLPLPTQTLLQLMQQLPDGDDTLYPGSPWIAASLCRQQDSLLLYEVQADQFDRLQTNLHTLGLSSTALRCVCDNGYKALKQRENLNPSQRALVFMDPPYQLGSDTEQSVSVVNYLQTHWRSARVAIWHPVSFKNTEKAQHLYRLARKAVESSTDILAVEMYPPGIKEDRYIVGTGMLLVNPPFGIDRELQEMLPVLDRFFAPSLGTYSTISIEKL